MHIKILGTPEINAYYIAELRLEKPGASARPVKLIKFIGRPTKSYWGC